MNIVVKVGTNTILRDGEIDVSVIDDLRWTVDFWRYYPHSILIVTSGAVACGSVVYQPSMGDIVDMQVAAAIGQSKLIETYQTVFSESGIHIAQLLYTYSDLTGERAEANRTVLLRLLERKIVPIINENDPVVTDELQALESFGDNAKLAALVAKLIRADLLVLMTDVDGVYSADPRTGEGRFIPEIKEINADILAMVSSVPTPGSKGGMKANVEAAEIAAKAGIRTIIANGRIKRNLHRIIAGEPIGTVFPAQVQETTR